MDRSNDLVSIDCEMLAYSFRGKLENLRPLSKGCCIYEVPPKIRMCNESLYTPKMVSIGPLHHGRQELKAMEEYKLRYLQQFLLKTDVRMENFLYLIKIKEDDLRNYYADTIKFGSGTFVEIIFLDAVFLIWIFLQRIRQFRSVDNVFSSPGKIKDILLDIMLLENQLPMFILEDLFRLAKLKLPDQFKEWPLRSFACDFFTYFVCQDISIDTTSIEEYCGSAKHFVDLLRLCLQPQKPDVNNSGNDGTESQDDRENAPSITKLHQCGIMFKPASTKNLLDIKFERGTLKIPKLTISDMSIHLLRNLQTFESLHSHTNFVNDYLTLLHCLLSTPQDVELLINAKVIGNRVSDSEGVSTLFQELSRDARLSFQDFYYSGLVKDLQAYCRLNYSRSKRYEWKAILRQNYFSNPWVSLSVIAAAMILILTFIQTVCSIIGLRK